MVAILDMPPAFTKPKHMLLRPLKMEVKFEHSFKESCGRESEPECLDSSSEESYSSSADLSCSSESSPGYYLTMHSLRSVTSAPLVLKSRINVTSPKKAVSVDSPTRSKLTQLLHDHNTFTANSPATLTQAQSARLFQIAWQMLPRNFTIRFALRDSSTMDQKEVKSAEFLKESCVLEALAEPDSSKARARECRMNKDFLRMYALDFCARSTGALPESTEEGERTQRNLCEIVGLYEAEDEDEENERQRISQLSQDKLWKCIILSPRSDPTPCRTIDHRSYIPASGAKHSRTGRENEPNTAMKPAGQLRRSRCLQSSSPNLGCTVPQYTLKGWENKRWTSVH